MLAVYSHSYQHALSDKDCVVAIETSWHTATIGIDTFQEIVCMTWAR